MIFMGWKQNLMGKINTAIFKRKDATIVVHSAEQKVWGEWIVLDIFSTLHLDRPIKIDFVVENDNGKLMKTGNGE